MDKRFKIQIFVASASILAFLVFTFNKPSITGHVSANFYRQNLSLEMDHSQNFLLTSDNIEPYFITSLQLSGEILGNGQVKIYIDNGKGQRLLVYENIIRKGTSSGGFSGITASGGLSGISGNAVKEGDNSAKENNDKWLIVKPINVLLEKETFNKLDANDKLTSGTFSQKCMESCTISMEISRSVAYRLVFLVEKGAVLKINELSFQTKE